jgi:hypothetical protein
MFDVEFPKYKDRLDVIFFQSPLINVNMASSHVFNSLHNYPISIMHVVDPKSIPTLLSIDDKF